MKANPNEQFTSLGLHYIAFNVARRGPAAPIEKPVLVSVEISVGRLLHLIGRRLVKSKHGRASCASGAIRLRLSRPEDQEAATEIWAMLKHEQRDAAGS